MRVLMLDLDTLRPDHLGCYGYHRDTSPNIDRIAAEGVRFTNYYCSDAPCLPSRSALTSGRFGILNGVVGHGGTAADMRLEGEGRGFTSSFGDECLPAVFRREGMRTVSISPFAERHSSWTFYAGFNEMYNTGKKGQESAEEVTPVALDWIRRNAKEDNWFLHINYWDPHTPYRTPADYDEPFTGDDLPEWLTDEKLAAHRKMVGPHSASEVKMFKAEPYYGFPKQPFEIRDRKELAAMINGYDNGIRYMDDNIGLLLDALREEGVADDLCILVTSDHGEAFGEFGIYGEHSVADYSTARIPMIVKWNGCQRGLVDDALHYQLDLAPTLSELFGKPPAESWSGQSYAKTLTEGAECGYDYLVLSQCAHVCQRSVRFGDYLYMRSYHDGYHLFPKEMLFNVKKDPHEQHDLAQERPELCDRAVRMLADWHDAMMRELGGAPDPMWTVMAEGGPYHCRGELAAYCERLKQTGRGEAVAELESRHRAELS